MTNVTPQDEREETRRGNTAFRLIFAGSNTACVAKTTEEIREVFFRGVARPKDRRLVSPRRAYRGFESAPPRLEVTESTLANLYLQVFLACGGRHLMAGSGIDCFEALTS